MSPLGGLARRSGVVLALATVCALPASVSAQLAGCPGFDPYIISKGQLGEVNWQGNLLLARGAGSSGGLGYDDREARRLAEADAQANALRVVNDLNLTWDQKVQDYLSRNRTARSQLQSRLRAARLAEERVDATMTTVTIEVPFFGPRGIVSGLLADRALVPPPAEAPPAGSPDPGTEAVTGLVVDARGHKVGAAMLFRIVDHQGTPVYTPGMVESARLAAAGTGAYVQCQRTGSRGTPPAGGPVGQTGRLLRVRPVGMLATPPALAGPRPWWLSQAAPAVPRSGRRPLGVKGAPDRDKGVTIVIGQQDAARIRQAAAKSRMLREGNVLLLLDPDTAGGEGRLSVPWLAGAPLGR